MSSNLLPARFDELEPWVADWAKAKRDDRYAVRKSKPIEELEAFYDAIAPRAEEAIEYLNGLDFDDLPKDAERLLQLLYSMVLVSYSVNIYRQPKIPDSGAAYFDCWLEPTV